MAECEALRTMAESTKDNGTSNSFAIVIGRGSCHSTSIDTIKINLNRPKDVSVIEPLPDELQRREFHRERAAAAAVYRNSIFVCGVGRKNEEIWRLDATSSKWSKCASMTEGRQFHSVAFVDHVLYICGGRVNSRDRDVIDDVEAYDTLDSKCSEVGKLAYAVHSSGNCVPVKSSLYIGGGKDAHNQNVGNVLMYDTKLNTCALLTNPMPRAYAWLCGELWENSIILLSSQGCFIYDIDTQTWKVRDKFKLNNTYVGVIVNDGKLFVIGCGMKNAFVRWIPVANILYDEFIEWKDLAKLTNNTLDLQPMFLFAVGKLEYPVCSELK